MKGLKKHTHKDRSEIIDTLVPYVKDRFLDNLLAFASLASYARNDDADYSDLELIVFVHSLPGLTKGVGRILDGMLIEIYCTTRELYLRETKEVTKEWYIAGSDFLSPIINHQFINELNTWKASDLERKCLERAREQWPDVQESTSKVLNAIQAKNHDAMSILTNDMILHMLKLLSFLNQTAYITLARFVTQAREFPVKPKSFEQLLELSCGCKSFPELQTSVETVFDEFESILEEKGLDVYENCSLSELIALL